MRGNTLPQLTWRWTKVNDVEAPLTDEAMTPYPNGSARHGEALDPGLEEALRNSPHGISKLLLEENEQHANVRRRVVLKNGRSEEMKVVLDTDSTALIDRYQVICEAGQRGELLLEVVALAEAAQRNAVIQIVARPDSTLRLMLVQRLNETSGANVSVIVQVEKGARVEVAHVDLGGRFSNFHYGCDLIGKGAETDISTVYLADGDEKLDLFYNVRHIGENTRSEIQVNGALLDRAHKSFRGTLDFLEGACGAEGNEEEYAVLLSDQVHSIAVPLLLCHEDDVMGNHAASAGRIDEEMLFYIMSRGFGRKEAASLIVEARMTPTLDRISNESVREEVRRQIHERIVQG